MPTTRLLIHAKRERAAAVRARLASLHGVKVHAITPEGRVFATFERENEAQMAQTLEELSSSPDVLDTMLIGAKDSAAGPRVDSHAGSPRAWYVRLISALQRRKYGTELESSRLWGRLPSPLFSSREKAALAYAEAMTDPARPVDFAVFERLQGQFSEQELLELTALIAFQNMTSKFNAALAVPSAGFCRKREQF